MQNALNRLRDIWQSTSRANQILLVTISGVAALVAIGFVYWASMPDYQTLVSNASPANAGKITAMLDQKKVNYRIVNESTIQVPAAEAAKLRMALAQDGLLESGSLGYAVLEKTGFGTTQAVEQENIRRAHEGEMEKSIQSLEPVRTARVHLAEGSTEPFVDPDKKDASASIIVHLKPGHELDKNNVNAIVSLVQAGYTNLSRKNINLVDGEGHLLFNGAEMSSGTAGLDDRQSAERRQAADLTALIRQQLAPALGADRFQVAVRVRLNLDRERETSRIATAGPKVSSSMHEETLSGSNVNVNRPPNPGMAANANGANPGGTAGGTAGSAANTYEASAGGGDGGKYVQSTTNSVFAPGTTEKVIDKAPGEAKHVAVSVLLDSDKVTADQGKTIRDQVANIVAGEGDLAANALNVRVDRFKFDNSAVQKQKEEQVAAASAERTSRMLGYIVPFALMLVMLVILARSLRRHVPKSQQLALAGAAGGMHPALAGAGFGSGTGLNMLVGDEIRPGMTLNQMEEALDAEGRVVPIRQGEQVHTYEVITEQFDANLESILHLSRSKPEMVARLVKSWISEEPIRK